MEAKKAAGYFNKGNQKSANELAMVQGRGIDEQY
jgi:hypothetical protein